LSDSTHNGENCPLSVLNFIQFAGDFHRWYIHPSIHSQLFPRTIFPRTPHTSNTRKYYKPGFNVHWLRASHDFSKSVLFPFCCIEEWEPEHLAHRNPSNKQWMIWPKRVLSLPLILFAICLLLLPPMLPLSWTRLVEDGLPIHELDHSPCPVFHYPLISFSCLCLSNALIRQNK
jgi:hypothetical protein